MSPVPGLVVTSLNWMPVGSVIKPFKSAVPVKVKTFELVLNVKLALLVNPPEPSEICNLVDAPFEPPVAVVP